MAASYAALALTLPSREPGAERYTAARRSIALTLSNVDVDVVDSGAIQLSEDLRLRGRHRPDVTDFFDPRDVELDVEIRPNEGPGDRSLEESGEVRERDDAGDSPRCILLHVHRNRIAVVDAGPDAIDRLNGAEGRVGTGSGGDEHQGCEEATHRSERKGWDGSHHIYNRMKTNNPAARSRHRAAPPHALLR